MIVFGTAISEPEPYVAYAQPGIRRAAEADSVTLEFSAVGTIGRSLNLLLDAAARHEDLEALVLVAANLEITDARFCSKVRGALADPDVALVGFAGASGVRTIAWWEGAVVSGPAVQRHEKHGGVDFGAFSWTAVSWPPAEVDTVDGSLLVLSPWAVRELRFDEALLYNYGFDLDFCLQARSAGRKVLAADFEVLQHGPLEMIEDLGPWIEGHIQFARKWEGRMPGGPPATTDWRARARRAEAEREAARAIAYSRRLAIDARIEALERELERTTSTVSWRLTRPLRDLNLWRRDRASRRAAGRDGRPGRHASGAG